MVWVCGCVVSSCSDTIVAWVKKKTGPPSALADSQDKVEQATKSSKVVVLGYFAKLDTATHKAFVAVAAQAEAVAFLHTTDKAVAAAYGLTKDGGAVLLRDFDSGNVVMRTLPLSPAPSPTT